MIFVQFLWNLQGRRKGYSKLTVYGGGTAREDDTMGVLIMGCGYRGRGENICVSPQELSNN